MRNVAYEVRIVVFGLIDILVTFQIQVLQPLLP